MELPCLPLVKERFLREVLLQVDEPRFYPDVRMWMFPQTWGSTALGFGGVGGSAMTTACTVVVQETRTDWFGVFFGDRLAYLVHKPNERFFEDLRIGRMVSVAERAVYSGS